MQIDPLNFHLYKMDQQVIQKTNENQRRQIEIEWEAVEREKKEMLHHRPPRLLGLLQFPDSLV